MFLVPRTAVFVISEHFPCSISSIRLRRNGKKGRQLESIGVNYYLLVDISWYRAGLIPYRLPLRIFAKTLSQCVAFIVVSSDLYGNISWPVRFLYLASRHWELRTSRLTRSPLFRNARNRVQHSWFPAERSGDIPFCSKSQ